MQEIGKKIKTLRQKNGWAQRDIADRMGISVPAYSKIEAGITDINVSRLRQIAEIYNVPLLELFSSSPVQSETYVDDLQKARELNDSYAIKVLHLQEYVIKLYEELNIAKKAMISS